MLLTFPNVLGFRTVTAFSLMVLDQIKRYRCSIELLITEMAPFDNGRIAIKLKHGYLVKIGL
jgi:hypothetical protein